MLSEDELILGTILQELHAKWMPHQGQIPVGRAIFYEGRKNIFIQAGRNWGKTDICAYIGTRYGLQFPRTESYYFAPYAKQIREILWASKRLQAFPPKSKIMSINETAMRITFTSRSFIKLEGADNPEAGRGIKPKGIIIYDELKDIKKSFIDTMDDNRAAYNNPAIYIGTPPEFRNHFVDMAEYAKNSPDWVYVHAPTRQNPHISADWLERRRARYLENGDEETWLREYEAVFVPGGKSSVFPQALKYKEKSLEQLLPRQMLDRYDLFIVFDPGSSSVFAVNFFIYNKYRKRILIVDEIYEQQMENMTARNIWRRVESMLKKSCYRDLRPKFIYDAAAAWFRNEMFHVERSVNLIPCDKNTRSIDYGISMIREAFNFGVIEIASHCEKTLWELRNYRKKDDGSLPDEDNHTIDNIRYFMSFVDFNVNESDPPKEKVVPSRRGWSLEEDMAEQNEFREID